MGNIIDNLASGKYIEGGAPAIRNKYEKQLKTIEDNFTKKHSELKKKRQELVALEKEKTQIKKNNTTTRNATKFNGISLGKGLHKNLKSGKWEVLFDDSNKNLTWGDIVQGSQSWVVGGNISGVNKIKITLPKPNDDGTETDSIYGGRIQYQKYGTPCPGIEPVVKDNQCIECEQAEKKKLRRITDPFTGVKRSIACERPYTKKIPNIKIDGGDGIHAEYENLKGTFDQKKMDDVKKEIKKLEHAVFEDIDVETPTLTDLKDNYEHVMKRIEDQKKIF